MNIGDKTMRENIRRIARLLREAAEELNRIYVVKRGQLEEEFEDLTKREVADKLIGLGNAIPVDLPEENGKFIVEEVFDGDRTWKGGTIVLEGTLEWLGKRFRYAECWIRLHPSGHWEVKNLLVRYPDTVGEYIEDDIAYWSPFSWEHYSKERREEIMSTGEPIRKEPHGASLRMTAPEDRRPPKKWWERCIERAKSFADDPESFCGGLWHHPEDFPGGEKMKESFGKPIKRSSTLRRRRYRRIL
jgi:hypothetical protein